MISAKILLDSINPDGKRLTSFLITYQRFILSEINTHRALSRNSASSRAIPISKMIKLILGNPAEPVFWGANQSGMQARTELSKSKRFLARWVWKIGCYLACLQSWLLYKIGVHKQIANRVTEPWAHITTIVSATDWGNFFNLRCHPDAQPEFQALAFEMLKQYNRSRPKKLGWGEWHIPFSDKFLNENLAHEDLVKIGVARAARTSYLTFDGDISHEKDFGLHDNLLESGHMSPFEHVAQAERGRFGNFDGYKQYRKMIPGENRSELAAGLKLVGMPVDCFSGV